MTAEVMPEGFEPRRRGRRPTYDVKPLLAAVEGAKNLHGIQRWNAFTMNEKEAESAKRQLERMGMFEVSLERSTLNSTLYVRYIQYGTERTPR